MTYSADKLVELCKRFPLAESINRTPEDPFAINYFHNLECILQSIETPQVSKRLREGGYENCRLVQVVYVNEHKGKSFSPTLGIRLWEYKDKAMMHRVVRSIVQTLRGYGYLAASNVSESTWYIRIRTTKPESWTKQLRYSPRLDWLHQLNQKLAS
jgi:hypothetical protein